MKFNPDCRMIKYLLYGLLLVALISCSEDDGNDLPSVEERVETAVEALRADLMAPANGWLLEYQPTPFSGSYWVLLTFDENNVRVRSDMPGDDGYFYDQTVPYRIDPKLDLELIIETYTMFHVLFEHQQSTFGGEFEFLYVGAQEGNLNFLSKTDLNSNPTVLSFTPSNAGDEQLLSPELALSLEASDTLNSIFFSGDIYQQLYIPSQNVSVFWEINTIARTAFIDMIAEGETVEEIVENDNIDFISASNPYILSNGAINFRNDIAISLDGISFSFSSFATNDLVFGGELVCDETTLPIYNGSIPELGEATLARSFFQSGGILFGTRDDTYSVNVLFVIDGDGNSLSEEGVINDRYDDPQAFVFNFGVLEEDNEGEPTYGVGLAFEDEEGVTRQHMRGFNLTEVVGNQIQIELTEEFFYVDEVDPPAGSEDNIRAVTDEIFADGTFHISRLILAGSEDLVLYKFRNICTGYEFLLVDPDPDPDLVAS